MDPHSPSDEDSLSEAPATTEVAAEMPDQSLSASPVNGEHSTTAPAEDASDSHAEPTADFGDETPESDELEDLEELDEEDLADGEAPVAADGQPAAPKARRKRKRPRQDAAEMRLQGRSAMCKPIADIAPNMLKTVKLRVLGRFLQSTRGLEDDDLTERIKKDADKLAEKNRILAALQTPDADVNRAHLKTMLLFSILLQEECYCL